MAQMKSLERKVESFKDLDFSEQTEMGEVMKNLDADNLDANTKMSSVDFNTRLDSLEINSILVIDEFMRLGIFPMEAGITRQKKRLAISLKGLGRQEKVRIIAGDREMKSGSSFGEKLSGLFQRKS